MFNILTIDLPFLTERMKILAANLHDKTKCVVHTSNLKQTLNHELVLKKVHRVIKFCWVEPYIDMNTDLRKKDKNYK